MKDLEDEHFLNGNYWYCCSFTELLALNQKSLNCTWPQVMRSANFVPVCHGNLKALSLNCFKLCHVTGVWKTKTPKTKT